jgi:STE24 endopeptidase
MDADYFYSSYHYSHPILTERLKAIGWTGEKKAEFKNAPEKTAPADVATGREL